jgi:hypothetical protein
MLVEEIAYEHWHRMLFARFLERNELLIHPTHGVPVTLEECADLAEVESEPDEWMVAAKYASAMLPGIFHVDSPVLAIRFAANDRLALEAIVKSLPDQIFTADDALGWVYQFWQSESKAHANRSGVRNTAATLPAVTQLFTEHYMVQFLLENSLGAWWTVRNPGSQLQDGWNYLRLSDGSPAAGSFEHWPEVAADITVMDPCCGSGHFLVAAAAILRDMRMAQEGLTPAGAAVAVIQQNLFGLELDPRCLELAAFNLALDAWRAGGYQPLPIPNLACAGLTVAGQRTEWSRLAQGDSAMSEALDRLYNIFEQANDLGSLIEPMAAAGEGLWRVEPDHLIARLEIALERERAIDPAAAVFGAVASGAAKAAQLLSKAYTLVVTNPPFLGEAGQPDVLRDHIKGAYAAEKNDLAIAMLSRWRKALLPGGTWAFVLPQAWMYLRAFRRFREALLKTSCIEAVARIGQNGFESISGGVVNVSLVIGSELIPSAQHEFAALDVSGALTPQAKAAALPKCVLARVNQLGQMKHAFASVLLEPDRGTTRLAEFVEIHYGSKPGQTTRVTRKFWELPSIDGIRWVRLESTPQPNDPFSGKSEVSLSPEEAWRRGIKEFGIRGRQAWGKAGVIVSKMDRLTAGRYCGGLFDDNTYVLVPRRQADLPAINSFTASTQFREEVRKINQKLVVDTVSLVQVPFSLEYWQRVASKDYPEGLGEPTSHDPAQWFFPGRIVESERPLQVAVARLLGYRWPAQVTADGEKPTEPDGVLCIPALGGSQSGAELLRSFLAQAFEGQWTSDLLGRSLFEEGASHGDLDRWLRDSFFDGHCRLFQQRPFTWHIWDGRRDGFAVLVNYHLLDHAKLQKVTYTYLGAWLERQRAEVAAGVNGSEERLAAAAWLQKQLASILIGEPPYDIFVRWKPMASQPIGWHPDLEDGVRLNIRPFVNARVLRSRVQVNWAKDRGKNSDGSDRLNDIHLTIAEKAASRRDMQLAPA